MRILAHQEFLTAAAAFEASTIAMIPMTTITKLVSSNNDLAWFFIKQLSVDLGIADERTVNLTQKHIRGTVGRVYSVFRRRVTDWKKMVAHSASIYPGEDLASLSNMTTSNAIRTLTNFASEKIIAIDGRKIKIISEDRLEKISKIG